MMDGQDGVGRRCDHRFARFSGRRCNKPSEMVSTNPQFSAFFMCRLHAEKHAAEFPFMAYEPLMRSGVKEVRA